MVPNSLRSLFAHISVVSSKGMLVNRESTPKIKLLIKILSPKWQESFAVNSPVVTGLKIGTKNFARLSTFKADEIGWSGTELSILGSCTLHRLYVTPCLLPTDLNNFLASFALQLK